MRKMLLNYMNPIVFIKFVGRSKLMGPCLAVFIVYTFHLLDTTAAEYSATHGTIDQAYRRTQQAISVTLTIQEGVGASSFSTTGYPVSVVVPFAESTLFDKDSLSISEGNPCQIEVIERWLSDGSVRHALVHFQARLTSRQKQLLTLTNTGPIVKPAPTQPVTVTSTSTYVQVDTGKVRFQISKTSFNLFDQLWFDQNDNGIYETTEQMIVSSVDNGGHFVPRTGAGSTQKDSSRNDIVVEIEESGPLRAVIKVSAPTFFRSTTDHVHGFAVRIYAFAGLSFVKVDYQLQNSDSSVVRSWPLYFEEMSVDLKFQFPGGVTPQVRIGSTSRQVVGATTLPARIQQTGHNTSSILYGSINASETNTYATFAKNAAFVNLQAGSTGVSIMMRNFWQAWPNGLAVDANGKVSIEMFPSWSAQYANRAISTTGLYWLKDMQHIYKEFIVAFHTSAPSVNRLVDTASTFQFPPLVYVPTNWYRMTKATLDMGGLLPPTLAVPSYTDTFSPDLYWDDYAFNEGGLYYKGNWVNFGDPEGLARALPCQNGGFPYDVEYYISTQYASHYYLAETWGIGELNVRPQSLPNYNFQLDYTRLLLTDDAYCNGSWRLYDNAAFKFAAPFLPNTDNIEPSYGARDDDHGWFYHVAQSYFYTGSYWMKDWYKFVGQFRRGFLTSQQLYQSGEGHALNHALQAIRITDDTDLITEFANYFRSRILFRQDKRSGSDSFGSDGDRIGVLTSSIINFMVLVQNTDIQLHAELFNCLSGWMEWNLNIGNFSTVDYVRASAIISPQSWYFWHTGKIEFWNQIEAYMGGGLGDPPYGAPWTTYPILGDDSRRRNYIFVKQSMRQDLTPPNPIVDLQGSFNTGKSVTLQWTGPDTAVRYHIVWSNKPIVGAYSTNSTFSNWWAANALGTAKVAKPGVVETLTIDIPYIEKPVYVAMFSFDDNNNMSGISNAAQVGSSAPISPSSPSPKAPVPVPVAPIVPLVTNPTPKAPASPPTVSNPTTKAPNAPVSPPTIANPTTNTPTKVPTSTTTKAPTKAPVPPPAIANPTPKAPTKAPLSTPMVANLPTKSPTNAPVLPMTVPIVPIASWPQAPLPKTKPPQSGPLSSVNVINIYPGDDFTSIVNNARPGDTIIVHEGNYTTFGETKISVGGTLEAPVFIQNAVGENRPRIQFTVNIASSTYLTIQGLEILSAGGNGIYISNSGVRDNKNITLEDLVIHHVSVGIRAESNIDALIIRKSHIYATLNEGEGLSVGCDDGSCVLSNSVIEYNWIHNTTADGIEIKKNSFGVIVRHNVVYTTKYVGILVYGSGSRAINVIEGNVMWDCAQAGVKVAADALVQNNLVFNSGYGFESDLHNGVSPKNLKIVHNTFLNNDVCLIIRSWNGQSDIIFANNAVYCITRTFRLEGGLQNVQISGNVFYPNAESFPPTSFTQGRSLEQDFKDFASFNAYPISSGQLRDKADLRHVIRIDFDGTSRVNQSSAFVGAYQWTTADTRKWVVTEGFKPFQEIDDGTTGSIPTTAPITAPIQSPTIKPTSTPCRLRRFCFLGRQVCFSSHNTVQILKHHHKNFGNVTPQYDPTDSDTILMSDLKVGDYVRSSGGQYTRVISFCHKDTKVVATFVQIHSLLLSNHNLCMNSKPFYNIDWPHYNNHTGQDRQSREVYDDDYVEADFDVCGATKSLPVLELSHDHMVYVFRRGHHHHHYDHHHPTDLARLTRRSEKGWVRAADVEIGDILIHRLNDSDNVFYGVVMGITSIQRSDGVYSPITTEGSLYVSNTLVSSYVAVLQTNNNKVMSVSSLKENDSSKSTVDANIKSSTTMLLFPPNVQHMIAHITLTPIRLLCKYNFEKYCQNEVYDGVDNGYAWYSQYILSYVEWLESIGTISLPNMFPQWMFDSLIRMFQWATTIVIIIPFLLLYFTEGSFAIVMNGYEAHHHYGSNNAGWLYRSFDIIPENFFLKLDTIVMIKIITVIMLFSGSFLMANKACSIYKHK